MHLQPLQRQPPGCWQGQQQGRQQPAAVERVRLLRQRKQQWASSPRPKLHREAASGCKSLAPSQRQPWSKMKGQWRRMRVLEQMQEQR